jgi:hypothetical protein
MTALFNESGQNYSYSRTLSDPGGENEVVMFKSCFPRSSLGLLLGALGECPPRTLCRLPAILSASPTLA